MAIERTSNSGNAAATSAPYAKQAPKNETKKPQGNTAAKQSPKETRTAVENTFGNVPQNSNSPASRPKVPAADAKGAGAYGKTPPNADAPASGGPKVPPSKHEATAPAGDLKTPAGGDAKTPAGGDAKAPAGGDAKAPAGGDAKTPAGGDAKAPAGGDAKTPAGGDAKTPAGGNSQAPAESKAPPAANPKAAPGEPGSIVKDENGQPVKTPDGKGVILNQNGNPIPVNKDGNASTDAKGNPYAVDKTGKYSKTEDGKFIVYANEIGGKPVGIKDDGKYVDDFKGNPKVLTPEGKYAKTVDGKQMLYNMQAGGKIAAEGVDGKEFFTGPEGVVYTVNSDGQYGNTEDGKYLAYKNAPDGKYVAVSDGRISTDNEGNAYALTPEGKYMQPEPGKFAVVNQYNKLVASDGETGWLYHDGKRNAYALTADGKYIQPEPGKFAVYNEQTGKTTAVDASGNPVADANGNPYMVGEDGKYAKTADGQYATYSPKVTVKDLDPVKDANQATVETSEGLNLYTNKATGEAVGVTSGGLVVTLDPKTNQMVKDPATGLPVVLNDPYAERPIGWQNLSPQATLDKLPKGTEHGDPMQIKNELFKNGALDKESLYAALGKYNSIDVYDALLGSSKYGSWDNAPKLPIMGQLVRPSEDQARAMMAALIAYQNQNGFNAPITEGKVPFLGMFDGDFGAAAFAYRGDLFANAGGWPRPSAQQLAEDIFHELNHVYSSNDFRNALKNSGEEAADKGVNNEVVTEYIANKWSNNAGNSRYDDLPGMKIMDATVKELGGGDINAGFNLLQKAYFNGDPVATQMFIAAAKKAKGEPYEAPIINPVDNDPTRPPVKPNEDPENTLKNLPQGTEKGDPVKIKDELFDQYKNLDVSKLQAAAAKYDPRDIYEALVKSGEHGTPDVIQQELKEGESVVTPTEDQARQAIAAMIAWQNENGKYNPLKQGKMPSVIFLGGSDPKVGGRSALNIYINAENAPGVSIATSIFHEMNHDAASNEFKQAYVDGQDSNSSNEIVTEYLANNWSGNGTDTAYEREMFKEGFKALEEAVLKMGNGDRNTGLDLLKRAYFAGDKKALKLLQEFFPPKNWAQ